MNATPSRKPSKTRSDWPRKVRLGRVTVTVYRRKTPLGNWAFMVANYAAGKRRFDSYPVEAEALEAAGKLARQLSEREVLAASLTNEQAGEYAAAVQTLAECNVPLLQAVSAVAECLKVLPDLPTLHAAAQFYARHHNECMPSKTVREVVDELLATKATKGRSSRYLEDLRSKLYRFAEAFAMPIASVTGPLVGEWLDGLKVEQVTAKGFRTTAHTLFAFAERRGYILAGSNPVAKTERVSVNGGDVEIYTPAEVAALLTAAAPDFLPCLAIQAFAGVRSAECERLDWADVDLTGGHIKLSAGQTKTASRRLVPIADNLRAWLAPYAGQAGRVWQGNHKGFYDAQAETAERAGIAWKANALRHSFVSYRLAQTQNAAQVAMEAGNSPSVVFKHYRELVTANQAATWFAISPELSTNVIQLRKAAQ